MKNTTTDALTLARYFDSEACRSAEAGDPAEACRMLEHAAPLFRAAGSADKAEEVGITLAAWRTLLN